MNEANVKALADIIAKIHGDRRYEWPIDDDDLARYIADAGVLVPRAISPKQMRQIGQWIEGETAGDSYDDEAYRVCVGLLEQVAQGNALIETEGSS